MCADDPVCESFSIMLKFLSTYPPIPSSGKHMPVPVSNPYCRRMENASGSLKQEGTIGIVTGGSQPGQEDVENRH